MRQPQKKVKPKRPNFDPSPFNFWLNLLASKQLAAAFSTFPPLFGFRTFHCFGENAKHLSIKK